MRAIISENLISAFSIIISIILIFLIATSLFSAQTGRAADVAYSNIAKGVADLIDRAAAEAGSSFIEYEVPDGLDFDINITYRNVIVSPRGMEPVSSSFSSTTHTGDYGYSNPEKLCVVKNRYDRTVFVKNGPCGCNPEDGKCDPECVVEGECDSSCYTSRSDHACIPMCASDGDGICDPDCYTNNPDQVWDSDCAQQNPRPDSTCDPDSDGVRDGFCDIDCFHIYNFTLGVCDPECKPVDMDGDGIEDKNDTICYTGCSEEEGYSYRVRRKVIPEEAFCRKENSSSLQCLGDDLYNCSYLVETCENGCRQPAPDHSRPASCGMPEGRNYNSSSDSSCCCIRGDCYVRERGSCILAGGYAYPADSSYCQAPEDTESIIGTIFLKSDGICDLDCAESVDVCDPDCPDQMDNCIICTPENESYLTGKPCCEGLIPCPKSGNCSKTCCGDGLNDTRESWRPQDHPSNWENNYTCPEDTGTDTPNRIETCESGSFTSAPCNGDNVMQWFEGKIEICSNITEAFLDRREWDINQIADDLLRGKLPPASFGWDSSRYNDACQRLQKASETIKNNENYNISEDPCCCAPNGDMSWCEGGAYPTEQCCGVGFCSDHTTALLSILRRLGVPPKDIYATVQFSGSQCQAHAFVVYRCDEELPDNMKLDECEGRWGQWLQLDATGHFIQPLSTNPCRTLCAWYNDYGLYATSEEGRIDASTGWAYPPEVTCNPSTWEGKETCTAADPTVPDISCRFNEPDAPAGICRQFGIECRWGEHAGTG